MLNDYEVNGRKSIRRLRELHEHLSEHFGRKKSPTFDLTI